MSGINQMDKTIECPACFDAGEHLRVEKSKSAEFDWFCKWFDATNQGKANPIWTKENPPPYQKGFKLFGCGLCHDTGRVLSPSRLREMAAIIEEQLNIQKEKK